MWKSVLECASDHTLIVRLDNNEARYTTILFVNIVFLFHLVNTPAMHQQMILVAVYTVCN